MSSPESAELLAEWRSQFPHFDVPRTSDVWLRSALAPCVFAGSDRITLAYDYDQLLLESLEPTVAADVLESLRSPEVVCVTRHFDRGVFWRQARDKKLVVWEGLSQCIVGVVAGDRRATYIPVYLSSCLQDRINAQQEDSDAPSPANLAARATRYLARNVYAWADRQTAPLILLA